MPHDMASGRLAWTNQAFPNDQRIMPENDAVNQGKFARAAFAMGMMSYAMQGEKHRVGSTRNSGQAVTGISVCSFASVGKLP